MKSLKIRNILTSAILFTLGMLAAHAAPGLSPQLAYIEKYADIAVRERQRTGVPASITLAQGMLESANGRSQLAVRGNNHFGIKCHDWKGQRIYHDDDRRHECFRKYKSAEESFRDHSDFLRYRDRYKFLFDYELTDYKAWAYGLKKAGYATDPKYPSKLIKLIEDYDLVRFDKASGKPGRHERPGHKEHGAGKKGHRNDGQTLVDVPETPTRAETPKLLTDKGGARFHLSLKRKLYTQNGVPFVYSEEGETYSSIADRYHLFLGEILKYNDLAESTDLLPGTVVYLQPKKRQAAKYVDKYVTEGGETLREISQRFAVRLKNLLKMNGMTAGAVFEEGEMVLLRKK